jgi:hypothetical protein
MSDAPKRQRSPEEIARRYFEIARLELEIAEQIEGFGPEVARSVEFTRCDPGFLLSVVQRAEAAWKEAGEPPLPDRDFVMARLQETPPSA